MADVIWVVDETGTAPVAGVKVVIGRLNRGDHFRCFSNDEPVDLSDVPLDMPARDDHTAQPKQAQQTQVDTLGPTGPGVV